MISCFFQSAANRDRETVSLRRIHKVPLERSSHCFSSVFVLYIVCSDPHLVASVLLPLTGVFLFACQISLDPLSLIFRLPFRGVT